MTHYFLAKDTTIEGASKIEIQHFKDLMNLKKQLDKAETEYWRRVQHAHDSEFIDNNGIVHPRRFKCKKCGTIEEYANP